MLNSNLKIIPIADPELIRGQRLARRPNPDFDRDQYFSWSRQYGIFKLSYIHINLAQDILFDAASTIKSPCSNSEEMKIARISTFWLLNMF